MLQTPDGPSYYPAVFVTCEETNDGSPYKRFPCFVAEVLSESTSDIDRGEKLHNYRKIPSLKAYILVSYSQQLVERCTSGSRTTPGAMRRWKTRMFWSFPVWI